MSRHILVWACAGLWLVSMSAADAVDFNWVGVIPTFRQGINWQPHVPPVIVGPGGALDTVTFNLGRPPLARYNVDEVSGANQQLRVRHDSAHLHMGDYQLLDPSVINFIAGFSAGEIADVILTGNGGNDLQANSGSIGLSAGSSGSVVARDLRWHTATALDVGRSGAGELSIEQGSVVTGGSGFIGRLSGSTGTVSVLGSGSSWTLSQRLAIGGSFGPLQEGGSGTLMVGSGASVDVDQDIRLFPGGQVQLQGGVLDADVIAFQGGGQFLWTGGVLHVRDFQGNLLNQGGALAPGHSVGATAISGNYTQQAAATLDIEIAGIVPGQSDRVFIEGNAILDGTLEVSLANNFAPVLGNSFTILETNFGNVAGQFDSVITPTANGLTLRPVYNPKSIVLEVVEATFLDGDFDENGVVNHADLANWKTGFGASGAASHVQGDADEDLDVDGADFLVWQRQLGLMNSTTAVARTAPEPALSLWLLALWLPALRSVQTVGRSHAVAVDLEKRESSACGRQRLAN